MTTDPTERLSGGRTLSTGGKVDPYMTPDQIEELVDAIKDQWSGVIRPDDVMTVARKVRAALTVGGYTGLVIASFSELSDAGNPIGLGLSGLDNIGNNEPFLLTPLVIPRDTAVKVSGPIPISEAEERLEDALGILTYKAEAYLTGQEKEPEEIRDTIGPKLEPLTEVLRLTMEPRPEDPEVLKDWLATLYDKLIIRYRDRGPSATAALYGVRNGRSIYNTWKEQSRVGGKASVVDLSLLETAVVLRERARHLARAMRQHDKEIATGDDLSDTTIEHLIGPQGDEPGDVYSKLLDLVRVAAETGFDPSWVLGEYLWAEALFEAAIMIGAAERGMKLPLPPLAAAGLVQLLHVEETRMEAAPDEVTEVQAFLAARVPADLRRAVNIWKETGGNFPLVRLLGGVIPDDCFVPT
jgi:hypothetical protein